MDWAALWLSLSIAAASTTILALVSLPVAWWLAKTHSRYKPWIEALAMLPLVLPPTVIGFYLLMLTSPQSGLGYWLAETFGLRLAFSWWGLVVATTLVNIPFVVRPLVATFEQMDHRLIEASWCLGVGPWQTWRRITLPLCAPGITTALTLAFTHALGEFGVVLMVGGNIPGVTRTLSMTIYDDVQSMNYASARQTSLLLVAGAVIALALVQWCQPTRRVR